MKRSMLNPLAVLDKSRHVLDTTGYRFPSDTFQKRGCVAAVNGLGKIWLMQ